MEKKRVKTSVSGRRNGGVKSCVVEAEIGELVLVEARISRADALCTYRVAIASGIHTKKKNPGSRGCTSKNVVI